MTPPRYEKIKEIFSSVLETDPSNRGAYLDKACDGNAELRAEVERLLNSFDEGYMETPAVAGVAEEITRASARSGQMIGHYRLLEMIGCGGMGEVYLAEDGKLGRKVAIKLLPDEVTLDEDRLKRFQLEARSASALNHPNVITIYEIGEWEEGHYIATEFVDGETLRQRLAEGRLSITEALECGVQLAAGIAAAHELGITHRDIKPENIMIRHDGLVKVLDFGLAKQVRPSGAPAVAGAADEPTIRMVRTEPGIIMGTLQYMSPEQARGLDTDVRTDIWSLGCVMYEMLCGRPPFSGNTSADVIAEIVKSPASPIKPHCPGVPERLEEIVGKTLEKDQPDRYQTTRDLLNDLKRLQKKIDASPELSRAGLLKRRLQRIGNKRAKTKRTSEKDLATVSSAEYLIWGIKAHRLTTAGIVLFVLALLGATAVLTRRYWRGPYEARIGYATKIKLAAQALDGTDLTLAERLLNETKPELDEEDLRGFEWFYLSRMLSDRTSSLPLPLAHEQPVDAVAFSPDGTKLATGSNDNLIRIWDVATGHQLSTLSGHRGWIASVEFSPDGRKLLSSSWDKTARIWDTDTGSVLLAFGSGNDPVSHPIFGQNGKTVIANNGGSIVSRDAGTGAISDMTVSTLGGESEIAFSPDGKSYAIRMPDQSVAVIARASGKTVATLNGHSGLVTDLTYSRNSKSILTGSTDGTAKIWDPYTGALLKTFTGHSGEIYDVAFSPDGTTVATGSTDNTIKLWSAEKGYVLTTLKGHRGRIQALAFSPDGRKLASGGGAADNSAKVWNVPAGEPPGVLRGHKMAVRLVTFAPGGGGLVSTSEDKTSLVWSTDEERVKAVIPNTLRPSFSPDGTQLLTGDDKSIRIWDLRAGRVRGTINLAVPASNVVYSPDGQVLASAHWPRDRTVRLWKASSGQELCSFKAHKSGPRSLSFFRDGRILTSSLEDNLVLAWDSGTCAQESSFAGPTEARYVSSILSNGKIRALEMLNDLRSLRLIAIETGSEIASFPGNEFTLVDAQLSPKGDRLATSTTDGTIKIWDSVTGQELLSIKPNAGLIESLAFSSDGKTLAAACADGTVRLFRSSSSE